MSLAEVRNKYPELNQVSDFELTSALHKKFQFDTGSTIGLDEFSKGVGSPVATTELPIPNQQASQPDNQFTAQPIQQQERPSLPTGNRPDSDYGSTSVPYNEGEKDVLDSLMQELNGGTETVSGRKISEGEKVSSVRSDFWRGVELSKKDTAGKIAGAEKIALRNSLEHVKRLDNTEIELIGRRLEIESNDFKSALDRFQPKMPAAAKGLPPLSKAEEFINSLFGSRGEVNSESEAKAVIGFEARRQGITPKELVEKVGARTGALERGIKDVGAGALSTGAGMLGYAARFIDDPAAQDLFERVDEKAMGLLPAKPEFIDKLMAGVGSTATFFIPGMGIAKGAQAISKVAPNIAKWLGSGAAAGMEAATEAGSVYESMLSEGKTQKQAEKAADQVFFANSALITVTNKLGLFGDQAKKSTRMSLTSAMEGSQEIGQQVISNVAQDKPAGEGALEAGAIGAIVGGGIAGVIPLPKSPQELAGESLLRTIDKAEPRFTAEQVAVDQLNPENAQVKVAKPETKKPVISGSDAVSDNKNEASFTTENLLDIAEKDKKIGDEYKLSVIDYLPKNKEFFSESEIKAAIRSARRDTRANDKVVVKASIEQKINSGKMPVFKQGDISYGVHPSSKQEGMVQVTTYSDTGITGDSQYNSIEEAISAVQLKSSQLMKSSEAKEYISGRISAEADYQKRKRSAFDQGVKQEMDLKGVEVKKINPVLKDSIILPKETTDLLTPVEKGKTRVYRAYSPTVKFDDVFDAEGLKGYDPKEKKGDFYTTDISYADYFRETYGSDAILVYADILSEKLKDFKVADGEYVIDIPYNNSRSKQETATVTEPETTIQTPQAKPKTNRQRFDDSLKIDNEKDDLILAIRKLGGLNVGIETDFKGRLKQLNTSVIGLKSIEQSNGGNTLEDLTEKLHDAGFIAKRDKSYLAGLIGKAESGKPIFSFTKENYEETIGEEPPPSEIKGDEFEKDYFGEPMLFSKRPQKQTIKSVEKNIKAELPEVSKLSVFEDSKSITISMIQIDEGARSKGIGSKAVNKIISYADNSGKTIKLTASENSDGIGTSSKKRVIDFYKSLGFVENKGKNKDYEISEGMYREPKKPKQEEFNSKALEYNAPGKSHVELFSGSYSEGYERPESGLVSVGDRSVRIPTIKNPMRREKIRASLINIIGTTLYEGKVRGKSRLGYYSTKGGEVRIKRYGDVEVMAHEMAHYLDFNSKSKTDFRSAYKDEEFYSEISGVSYTNESGLNLIEGFAEFVRLWLTRYPDAVKVAPKFTKKFEEMLSRDKKLNKGMKILQDKMHQWYYQGDQTRLRGVNDGNKLTKREQLDTILAKRPTELMRQKAIDHIHAAKVIEREIHGFVPDAVKSGYKGLQLLNGIEGIFAEMVKRGSPVLNADGSIGFSGASLERVFKQSIKRGEEVFRAQQEYFIARRARETKDQGRENLLTEGMIDAGLRYANRYPWFEKSFSDYQEYKTNFMGFMVKTGYIEESAANAMLEVNKNHVPLNRVVEGIGASFAGTSNFQRYKGGTQNIQNIYDNIVQGDFNHLRGALQAHALRRLYEAGLQSDKGGAFFSKITTDSEPVKIQIDQMATTVARAMSALDVSIDKNGDATKTDKKTTVAETEKITKYFSENPEELMFWTFGNQPKTAETMVTSFITTTFELQELTPNTWNYGGFIITKESSGKYSLKDKNNKSFGDYERIDFAVSDAKDRLPEQGKRQWIEIQREGELITDMLDNMNGWALPAGLFGKAIGAAYAIKNAQTLLITSMPQFSIPNLARDIQTATIISGGKFKPIYHNMLGFGSMLKHSMGKDSLYSEMLANGGGWAGRARSAIDETAGRQKHDAPGHWANPRLFLSGVLNAYVRIIDSPEMSTRVGYYIQQRNEGKSAPESAFAAREISTDFRKHGSYAPFVMLQRTIPFHGAFVQSVDRDIRAFSSKDGEIKFSNLFKTESGRANLEDIKVRMGIAAMGFAAITLLLASLNEDEDWYKDLTPDERVRFFHITVDGERYQIPKPHGFFSMVMQAVETMVDYVTQKEGADASKVMMYSLAYNLNDDFFPGIVNPWVELALNKNFAGSPIVPRFLERVSPEYRFTERTPQLYVELGETMGISPVAAQHITKGYLGYLENFISDAAEMALWNQEAWGERPFQSGAKQYFGKQFLPKEVPYRTRWIEKYYDLRKKADTAKADLSLAEKWVPFKTKRMVKALSDKKTNFLSALGDIYKDADKASSELRQQSMYVMYDKTKTIKQKESGINEARRLKNRVFKDLYLKLESELNSFNKAALKDKSINNRSIE